MADSEPTPCGPRRRHRWPRILAASAGAVLLLATGLSWFAYEHLDGNIRTDQNTEDELAHHHRPPPGPAENILLIGTDSRSGANDRYGEDSGTARSDTVILLHIAEHGRSAVAVSIPRDLMVRVPACTRPDGGTTVPRFAQFNWSYAWGGAACTILTVEQLTGVRIDHHLAVDFTGFKTMVDAVDGVEVCVADPVHDTDAHLDLTAGRQVLHGEQALAFVRARHAFGNGSDTERMDRQQAFLASLVKKVKSDRVLLNPARLYPVLDAATRSLSADPGLSSLTKLYDLVGVVQHIPSNRMTFLTVPRRPYPPDPNRDQLAQPQAARLFAALRADRPVVVRQDGGGSGPGPGATGEAEGTTAAGWAPHRPSPGAVASPAPSGPSSAQDSGAPPPFHGTTADRDVCAHRG